MTPGHDSHDGPVEPAVSVVVISYNDAKRLPRAIRSVQRQTLRAMEIIVVDDASTDGTADVVRALAQSDPRIRYACLEVNSGGCSAPRNRGLELARAPWVMFCDSDDEYERHACKNLLEAAERTGADVVCGTAERVDTRTGRVRRWRPEVHEQELVTEGLSDLPGLLYDTISVNKIYRADLLRRHDIRFPEGLLFEDQLFTLEAMAAAERVAVIPQVVYRWYVDRLSDEPSITQRRNEARNVESRIEVNRRIDAFLAARGDRRLAEVKALKFLKHDLYLYLASMLEVDDETATVLMDRLAPYVEQADLRSVWQLRPALRVAVYHLLLRDLAGIREAMRFVKWASVVDVPIVVRDGREFWGCSHVEDGPAAAGIDASRWLDVTDLGISSIPFSQRRYLHRVESFEVRHGSVLATGSSVDYDGALADVQRIELQYLVGGERAALSVPAHWTGTDGGRRQWRAEGRPDDRLRRTLGEKDRGTLGVVLHRDGHVNVTSVRSPETSVRAERLTFPGRARWTGVDAVELVPHDNGAIGWRAVRSAPWRGRLARLRATWFRLPGTTRLAAVTRVVHRDGFPAVAAHVGRLLPRRRIAVLEVDGGRAFDGNVRAIADGLGRATPPVALAWVYRAEPSRVPPGADAVERKSVREAWLLSRCRVRIDDGTSDPADRPNGPAVSVNAGEGVPVHRLGLDDPAVLVSRSAVASVRRRARAWDVMVSPSAEAADVLRGAFGYRGRMADAGLARMDAVVRRLGAPDGMRALRRELDLPGDRAVVLYVPASRHDGTDVPLIDLEAWAPVLGRRVYLLVRQPGVPVPTRLRFAVRDITGSDVEPFIGASDLVVSDYSSYVGDAALIDRPLILFQPDRDIYVNRTHGLYPGTDAVGPQVRSMDELVAQVGAFLDDPQGWDAEHGRARRDWAGRWCGPADAGAAERAVAAILAAMEGR